MGTKRGIQKSKAVIEKNPKGFGFLVFESVKAEDVFLPPHVAEKFFHGDRVEVSWDPFTQDVEDLKLLSHRAQVLVGRYEPHPRDPRKGGVVVFERKRAREEIFVAYRDLPPQKIQARDWVKVAVQYEPDLHGKIVEAYGPDLPASADLGMISGEFGLIEEHAPEAVRFAEKLGKSVDVERALKEGRSDFRTTPFITIDGETARDFDDAITVEKLKSGFVLWVAIADVSHYVTEGTALDDEARERATSVYFPERAFHMLPRALSENLCSLKPDVERLAMVAKMEFDFEGVRKSTKVYNAVIRSHRRATYTEIQKEYEQHLNEKNWEYRPHFELYKVLKQARITRGTLDFEFPEAEVVVDSEGNPTEISSRPRADSHRLIEEFMIAANEAVTHFAMDHGWPFVFRIHEAPSGDALHRFAELARNLGAPIAGMSGGGGGRNRGPDAFMRRNQPPKRGRREGRESRHPEPNRGVITLSPTGLSQYLRGIQGHPAAALLNHALLRAMKQARYSASFDGHFGLASSGYTHFTSPIRRYPDLVVHRVLKRILKEKHPPQGAPLKKLQVELEEISEHSSFRERLASDADREAIKLKQARMMMGRTGEVFPGQVSGLTENGFFVRTKDPFTEGFVSKDSLSDDFYSLDEKRMVFVGYRKKKVYRVGQEVEVQVSKACLERRQIDFVLKDSVSLQKMPGKKSRSSRSQSMRK